MTGFGQAKAKIGQRELLVEFRSVNHRHLDFSVRMPGSLSVHESELRKLVSERLKRGKVNAYIAWNGEGENEPTIDDARIKKYVDSLKQIARKLRLKADLSVSDLIALPNVFNGATDREATEKQWPAIQKLIHRAVARLVDMRTREGQGISKDIEKRLASIRASVQSIRTKAKRLPLEYKQQLQKRISELSDGVPLDPKSLAKEVALLAERSDITEELVRLDHHLTFFQKTLGENGEIGKRLDFISQEIHRETNTIASKAGNFPIAKDVIGIKTEIEKIREQVQNIE